MSIGVGKTAADGRSARGNHKKNLPQKNAERRRFFRNANQFVFRIIRCLQTLEFQLCCSPVSCYLSPVLPFSRYFSRFEHRDSPCLPWRVTLVRMSIRSPQLRAPNRVHLHAYERLNRICAEIQRGGYPKKADLARLIERDPRTVQRD